MNRKEEANLAKAALSLADSDHLTIYSAYLGYGPSSHCGKQRMHCTAWLFGLYKDRTYLMFLCFSYEVEEGPG